MSKRIKTWEEDWALSVLGEYTSWTYNNEYDYSTGTCLTKKGMIELYHQAGGVDQADYATARLLHKGRIRDLITDDKVTRNGWLRIVKKWARNIRKCEK